MEHEDIMSSRQQNEKFDELLQYIKRNRGFDFSAYKRSSLMRRVFKRMQLLGLDDFGRYEDYLEVHTEEFTMLFNHILINVTAFFRDPQAWGFLQHEVLSKIIQSKREEEPVRVWSAGCATGQEAYTIAMVFGEALGPSALHQRVKIYASDADEDALAQARQASYTAKEVEDIDPTLLEKYFDRSGDRFVFRNDMRRVLIFGRHDLVNDPPISRIDLLVCRNTLMYFHAEAQSRILSRFHFALNDAGYLFLGKAEMLLTHANIFNPLELRHRIFTKVTKVPMRDRLLILNQAGEEEPGRMVRAVRIREMTFEHLPLPQILVDVDGVLTMANERARTMFGLSAKDIGRPFRDLEISYRPAELRSVVEEAYSERRVIQLTNVERHFSDRDTVHYDIEVVPLQENGLLLGASITFYDVSKTFQLQSELQRSKQELETAYEELQSTNEELETTNEELQSTVEELETTNEELQSTNEELETMNEELQSTNEELQTVNAELRERTDEVGQSNLFLKSILGGLRAGVVVLDSHLSVLIWNHRVENLWGLREEEVKGRSIMTLDIGLPVERLRRLVQACLENEKDYDVVVVPAVNRRGKSIVCRISCSPLGDAGSPPSGVILLMEEFDKDWPDVVRS